MGGRRPPGDSERPGYIRRPDPCRQIRRTNFFAAVAISSNVSWRWSSATFPTPSRACFNSPRALTTCPAASRISPRASSTTPQSTSPSFQVGILMSLSGSSIFGTAAPHPGLLRSGRRHLRSAREAFGCHWHLLHLERRDLPRLPSDHERHREKWPNGVHQIVQSHLYTVYGVAHGLTAAQRVSQPLQGVSNLVQGVRANLGPCVLPDPVPDAHSPERPRTVLPSDRTRPGRPPPDQWRPGAGPERRPPHP